MSVVSKSLQVLTLAVVLLPGLSPAQVQRHALVQLATAQTCRPCVDAMRVIDVAKHRLGDSLIVIEYEHGGLPVPGERGFEGPISDVFCSYYGIYEWPALSFGLRDWTEYPWSYYLADSLWVLKSVIPDLVKPPVMDFRIVNVTYDPDTQVLSADLDVFALDKNSLPSEDTCDYLTTAVVTEEDVVLVHYNSSGTDSNFHEHAAARELADDSACGTRFLFGTKSATGPHLYRRHIAVELLNDLNHDQLRLKAVVGIASHSGKNHYGNHASLEYLDANQSDFVTHLPTRAPDSMWILYPRTSTRYSQLGSYRLDWSGSELGIPCSIDATTDNGATWIPITTTSANSFNWTIPTSFAGQSVRLRVARIAKPDVAASTLNFRVDANGTVPHVAILRPSQGEMVRAANVYQIVLDVQEYGPARTVETSLDNGEHWTNVGTTASNVLLWNVPNVNATQSFIRVVNGQTVDTSFAFSIARPLGSVQQLTVDRYPGVPAKTRLNILWFNANYVGDSITAYYSLDSGFSWLTVGHTSVKEDGWQWMSWSVPDTLTDHARILVQTDRGITAHTGFFSIVSPLSVIIDQLGTASLRIRANPVNDLLTIELPSASEASISVCDITGRLVLQSNYARVKDGSVALSTSSLPPGSYYAIVKTAAGVKTAVFMKME